MLILCTNKTCCHDASVFARAFAKVFAYC